jgi:hypothetical protein
MSRNCRWIAFVLSWLAFPALADNEPAKKPAATMIEVVVRLHDGTTIRKAVIEEKLELATKYGKLSVPIGDIRRIEFGLHLSEETSAQVARASRNLGSDKFAERETASKDLVALGHKAYPALQEAAASTDKETAKRVADAIDRIRATVSEDLLKLKNHDVIHTRDSVVGGKISNAVIKAKTATLGELQFKVEDLQSLHSMARTEIALAVEPSADGKLKWLDTGVFVETDMDLILRRSGQIEVVEKLDAQVPIPPAAVSPSKYYSNVPARGSLLGKIGDKGDAFIIGERLEAKAAEEGRLFLAVVPHELKVAGKYQVDVRAGLDLAPGLKRMERAAPAPTANYGAPPMPMPAFPVAPR